MARTVTSSLLATFWSYAGLAAQSAQVDKPADECVPFVAKLIQRDEMPTVNGVYARDSRCLSYRRVVLSSHSRIPLVGPTDHVLPVDVSKGIAYLLDFKSKTAHVLTGVRPEPFPVTREQFEQEHSKDLAMGEQTISGVECEGYRLHDPKGKKKKKYVGEGWYAPSLDFAAIKTESRSPGGDAVTTILYDIQVGKEPDLNLFRIPAGFKLVQ